MELKCAIQTYSWGKYGMNSVVASLIKSSNADFIVDEQKTYAELWMGTHENGPSYLKNTDVLLQKHIQDNIEVLGSDVVQTFGSNLSFLFKVLSINKALSIQVHPDKVMFLFSLSIKSYSIIIDLWSFRKKQRNCTSYIQMFIKIPIINQN